MAPPFRKEIPGNIVFAVDFKGSPPTETFVSGDHEDPIAAGLKVKGAIPATSRAFRMVCADGNMAIPLATREYRAWALGCRFTLLDGMRGPLWLSFAHVGLGC